MRVKIHRNTKKSKRQKKSHKLVKLLYKSRAQLILDYKEYFCFNGDKIPDGARCYTNDKAKCSDNVRFIGKNKYPKKIIMWIPISNRSTSKPYFRLSESVAVKTDIDINECLQPKL